jgi:DNA-binding MarR family transcriptional regulator
MQEPVKQLSSNELGAWRGFLRVHAALVRELDRELIAAHGLPLRAYEVLLYLESAPEGRLRMSELAGSVLLSQSGLTRLVDRLEQDALVERRPCEDDRRGFWAEITPVGSSALRDARRTHLAGVRDRFISRFDPGELRELGEFWERIVPGSSR